MCALPKHPGRPVAWLEAMGTVALAVLGFGLLAGCASFQGAGGTGSTTASILPDSGRFHPGLKGAELKALLGSPESTRQLLSGGVVWTYRYRVATDVKAVPIGTIEVPAVNPLTGQPITRTEQVYENHATDLDVFLHLLLVDDQLVEWRFIRKKSGSFQ
ncbi:MAG TPA: hypothetical protein VL200_08640 [Lacunisphaera sp.]|jgi:hypothetical protein|nr:hypothetical protein [Lacunisphaera sp.]